MPKIKAHAGRLKDSERFYRFNVEKKNEDTIKPRKILEEKGFKFPKLPTRTINNIHTVVA